MNQNDRKAMDHIGKAIEGVLAGISFILKEVFGRELSFVIVILTSEEEGKPGYLIGSDVQDLDIIHKHLADSLAQSKSGAMFDSVQINSH
ncbi:MAG: hypothetical protein V4621_07815 [Pseudomonadota bacterium]